MIVTLSEKGEKKQQILSNVERQLGRIKGKRSTAPFESQLVKADDTQQRGFTQHLNDFYDKVLLCLENAQSVLIFGPGEAKGELKILMEKIKRDDRTVSVESADKMTNRQIAEKVRLYFASQNYFLQRGWFHSHFFAYRSNSRPAKTTIPVMEGNS